MNEDDLSVGSGRWRRVPGSSIAGGDVECVCSMAAEAGIARRRVISQRTVRIRGCQRSVDLVARVRAAVAKTVGVRCIVVGTLIPEADHARRSVAVEKVRVSKVESEVERRDDAAAAGETW